MNKPLTDCRYGGYAPTWLTIGERRSVLSFEETYVFRRHDRLPHRSAVCISSSVGSTPVIGNADLVVSYFNENASYSLLIGGFVVGVCHDLEHHVHELGRADGTDELSSRIQMLQIDVVSPRMSRGQPGLTRRIRHDQLWRERADL
jgi:hypothetical protein